jgi:predicted RNase H-like HicB family nuclease
MIQTYVPSGEFSQYGIIKASKLGGTVKVYNYTVIFEPVKEGGFDVIVPAIPETCTFGNILEEAKIMAEDAIKCYLESALEEGERIPEDKEPSIERIAVIPACFISKD